VAVHDKKLSKIFPLPEHWKMVLILDDNNVTWDHVEEDGRNAINNLIHCDKYEFWRRTLGETHNPVPLEKSPHGGGGSGERRGMPPDPSAPSQQGAGGWGVGGRLGEGGKAEGGMEGEGGKEEARGVSQDGADGGGGGGSAGGGWGR
jgi:hypothetical protein